MSADPSPVPLMAVDAMMTDVNNQPRKSYRRKYRKIMVKFEERMRESTGLFKDEQRIFDISQRLAEQTDQILELLLELNNSPEVPPTLRYDLNPSGTELKAPTPESRHRELFPVHQDLRLNRYEVQKGERTPQSHQEFRERILGASNFSPVNSYASLSKIATITPGPYDKFSDPSISSGAGYLTIKQEEQYLQSLDSFVNNSTNNNNTGNPRAHAANSLGSKNTEKTADRERELQLRHPVSVYNWLRRHQPQVFLQDHETNTEKNSKVSGSRSSKRTAASKEAKQEQDYYDEDGFAMEHATISKGKRKRADDGAFRPKGGKPGGSAKKRKEDSGKRSKRSSMDARAQ